MILSQVQLRNRANEYCEQQGLDTLEKALDPEYFKSFPHSVTYRYNSRGFRDTEWPDDISQLHQAIWCVGDSFTVGIGSAFEHTWPQVLQQRTQRRSINVSMDGASNNWIARQASCILKEIQPQLIVIHWSYLHRREGLARLEDHAKYSFLQNYNAVKEPHWPNISKVEQFSELPAQIQNELLTRHNHGWKNHLTDDQLRMWHIRSTIESDIKNTCECLQLVDQLCVSTRIIHTFIPEFVLGFRQEFYDAIKSHNPIIPDFQQLDRARDRHHYDLLTSQHLVDLILPVLKSLDSI